jgi:hypothetical protein
MMLASVFGWRAACRRRGGNPPAPAFPGGETGKGGSNSLRRRLFLIRLQVSSMVGDVTPAAQNPANPHKQSARVVRVHTREELGSRGGVVAD